MNHLKFKSYYEDGKLVTQCDIVNEGQLLSTGKTVKSDLDQPDKAVAQYNAFRRAITDIPGKNFRGKLWDEFFQAKKRKLLLKRRDWNK